jgi:uncharacterized protein YjbJ (UPF0337 family)
VDTGHPTHSLRKEQAVSASKKAKDKAQAAKGKAKKGAGKALADPVLEGRGKAEEAKGNLKQAGERSKTQLRNDPAWTPADSGPSPRRTAPLASAGQGAAS